MEKISVDTPILIAGPTASGKSALALRFAQDDGRTVVNADALQVFDCWQVLSARPAAEDLAVAEHALYGHVPYARPYSVGDWLREVEPFLAARPAPVIVGGTGLYFRALTEGLAEIPPIPGTIRREADTAIAAGEIARMVAELDAPTRQTIDTANPARVQRAWEVQRATGRGLKAWQTETPPPRLPIQDAHAIVLQSDPDWLNARITKRFDTMIAAGALHEVRAVASMWDPALPASKAIGAAELLSVLRGEMDEAQARDRAIIATRQYAKRQRTWFRARMRDWHWQDAETL